jgi:hypothetical protein
MAGAGVIRRNNVLMTGRADSPVTMLANGFGCDQTLAAIAALTVGPRP